MSGLLVKDICKSFDGTKVLERINLVPFPRPALPGFNGTMEHLTSCDSFRCSCVLNLFINTSSLKKPQDLPRLQLIFICMPGSSTPERPQQTAHMCLSWCCLLTLRNHQPSQISSLTGLNHFNQTASGLQTLCLRLTSTVT